MPSMFIAGIAHNCFPRPTAVVNLTRYRPRTLKLLYYNYPPGTVRARNGRAWAIPQHRKHPSRPAIRLAVPGAASNMARHERKRTKRPAGLAWHHHSIGQEKWYGSGGRGWPGIHGQHGHAAPLHKG